MPFPFFSAIVPSKKKQPFPEGFWWFPQKEGSLERMEKLPLEKYQSQTPVFFETSQNGDESMPGSN